MSSPITTPPSPVDKDPNIIRCCTCGYTWERGQHGGHSCSDALLKKLRAMEEAFNDWELDLAEGADGRYQDVMHKILGRIT
jgi:hypothetical protein